MSLGLIWREGFLGESKSELALSLDILRLETYLLRGVEVVSRTMALSGMYRINSWGLRAKLTDWLYIVATRLHTAESGFIALLTTGLSEYCSKNVFLNVVGWKGWQAI